MLDWGTVPTKPQGFHRTSKRFSMQWTWGKVQVTKPQGFHRTSKRFYAVDWGKMQSHQNRRVLPTERARGSLCRISKMQSHQTAGLPTERARGSMQRTGVNAKSSNRRLPTRTSKEVLSVQWTGVKCTVTGQTQGFPHKEQAVLYAVDWVNAQSPNRRASHRTSTRRSLCS
jgi:hypothetical protein